MNTPNDTGSTHQSRRDVVISTYRMIALAASVVFAVVGAAFVLIPGQVGHVFNILSPGIGLPQSPEHSAGLYDVLAGAYMYVVTVLAFGIYRDPQNVAYSSVLISAKSASAVLSILYFVFDHPYLIFLTNAVVDGSIAGGFLCLRTLVRKGAT